VNKKKRKNTNYPITGNERGATTTDPTDTKRKRNEINNFIPINSTQKK